MGPRKFMYLGLRQRVGTLAKQAVRSIHTALQHDDQIIALCVVEGKKFTLLQWFN